MPSISDIIKNKTTRDETRTQQLQMERESISAMRDSSLTMITSDPEHYMEYLNLQADNIRCSVGNVALTMAQLQGAAKIGTTDFWHTQGRYVREDAINAGAKVFVPPRNKQYPEYSHTAVFAALGGEIALARAHDRGYNLGFKRETFALDAQSVSYMVCRRFGVECPAPDMAEYVAEIFENYPASNRGEVLEGIRDAARKAGDSIEQTINPRQQERGGQRHFKAH